MVLTRRTGCDKFKRLNLLHSIITSQPCKQIKLIQNSYSFITDSISDVYECVTAALTAWVCVDESVTRCWWCDTSLFRYTQRYSTIDVCSPRMSRALTCQWGLDRNSDMKSSSALRHDSSHGSSPPPLSSLMSMTISKREAERAGIWMLTPLYRVCGESEQCLSSLYTPIKQCFTVLAACSVNRRCIVVDEGDILSEHSLRWCAGNDRHWAELKFNRARNHWGVYMSCSQIARGRPFTPPYLLVSQVDRPHYWII